MAVQECIISDWVGRVDRVVAVYGSVREPDNHKVFVMPLGQPRRDLKGAEIVLLASPVEVRHVT